MTRRRNTRRSTHVELKELGSALRTARKQRKLSLTAVANAVGKSAATLSRIEVGFVPLDVSTLIALSEVIGFSAGEMLINIQMKTSAHKSMWRELRKIAK